MKLTTIENVVDKKADTLLKALRSIKSVYINKNIFITTLYMDNKFEVLHNALRDEEITLNTKHSMNMSRKSRDRSRW